MEVYQAKKLCEMDKEPKVHVIIRRENRPPINQHELTSVFVVCACGAEFHLGMKCKVMEYNKEKHRDNVCAKCKEAVIAKKRATRLAQTAAQAD